MKINNKSVYEIAREMTKKDLEIMKEVILRSVLTKSKDETNENKK